MHRPLLKTRPPRERHSALEKFIRRFQRLYLRRRSASPRGLLSPEQMRDVLLRERQRSDRNGHVFSLLTFLVREEHSPDAALPLIGVLKNRLRSTDELGWLAPGCIGAVLPYTPAAGAWKVADDVIAAISLEGEPPACEVFCYPNDEPAASSEEPHAGQLLAEFLVRPARSMEPLFVRPMPFWKRGLDMAGALSLLLLLSPLLLLVAVTIRLGSPGPILFRQRRTGAGGRAFTMLKFRTMVDGADLQQVALLELNEQDGPAFKIKNDPRVTRIGRLLRVTSIDELPQLWNVLRGEMSLVGPRPLPCHESDACRGWQRRRLDVTPGLTCIWQVSGRSMVSFDSWVRMDLKYIASRSVGNDLRLLLRTLPAVLARRGAR
jgi:lipopolysaccharide/colanic/teichoic acid biosynthesis glycosyltransferase